MTPSETWRERDRKVLWHPFTQQLGWMEEDFPVIVAAEGVHLIDADGRRYLDGVSSLWCNVHGHRVPAIDAAIRAQLDRAAHTTMLGLCHPLAIELAERLVRIAPPGLTRVFYSDSGSEAMEIALKMAYQYWQQIDVGSEAQSPLPAIRRPDIRPQDLSTRALSDALDAATADAIASASRRLDDETLALALSGCPAPLAAKVFRLVPADRALDVRRKLGRRDADDGMILAARRAFLDALRPIATSLPTAAAGRVAARRRRVRDPRRKHLFLTFGAAYHGDTVGSVSLGGIDLFHTAYGPLLFKTARAPSPAVPGTLAAVEKLFAERHADLAAAVIEPLIQGAAGMLVHPQGFLRRLRALCDANDVLLICDEVATGFGRTGTMFACEREGVSPDLMAVAKGFTGGYLPLAATLTSEDVYDAFLGAHAEKRTFFHGHTFTGNPLACAAALASLDLFERDQVLKASQSKIAAFAEGLGRLECHPHVREVRRCGFMAGIELVKDKTAGTPFDDAERKGHQVALEARVRGVVLRPLGDVVVLMPPLAIPLDDLQRLIDITRDAIDAATR
jgi:adenosylmethionine-8-amino-7-oxononanoate aminotransferase